MQIIYFQIGFKNEQIELENFHISKLAKAQFQEQIDCRDGRCLNEIKLQGIDSKDRRMLSCRRFFGALVIQSLGYSKC